MVIRMILFRFILYCLLSPSVTLRIVDAPACSGNDVTFLCEDNSNTRMNLLWNLTAFPNFSGAMNAPAITLRGSFSRIGSSDTSPSSSPSRITILSATSADNEAMIQCGIFGGERSEVISPSIREKTLTIVLICQHIQTEPL